MKNHVPLNDSLGDNEMVGQTTPSRTNEPSRQLESKRNLDAAEIDDERVKLLRSDLYHDDNGLIMRDRNSNLYSMNSHNANLSRGATSIPQRKQTSDIANASSNKSDNRKPEELKPTTLKQCTVESGNAHSSKSEISGANLREKKSSSSKLQTKPGSNVSKQNVVKSKEDILNQNQREYSSNQNQMENMSNQNHSIGSDETASSGNLSRPSTSSVIPQTSAHVTLDKCPLCQTVFDAR